MKMLRSFRLWCAALLCLVVVSVVVTPTGNTRAARIAHLEALVRCPSCDNLSVAQSTQSSSLAVRAQITSLVTAGESDAQILTTIEQAYGPSVLLSPSTTGIGVVLWAGPVLVILVAVLIGARLRRRT